jgi:hypothetical protein
MRKDVKTALCRCIALTIQDCKKNEKEREKNIKTIDCR